MLVFNCQRTRMVFSNPSTCFSLKGKNTTLFQNIFIFFLFVTNKSPLIFEEIKIRGDFLAII